MSHKRVIDEYEIPYKSADGATIVFPYKPLNGVVFIWPKPLPTMQGTIYLAEAAREQFKTSKGVVLAAHRGVTNKRTKQWVECELKPGDEVLYDKSVPWNMVIAAPDGTEHKVELMGMLDVNALIINSEVTGDEGQSIQTSTEGTYNQEEVKVN